MTDRIAWEDVMCDSNIRWLLYHAKSRSVSLFGTILMRINQYLRVDYICDYQLNVTAGLETRPNSTRKFHSCQELRNMRNDTSRNYVGTIQLTITR